MKLIKNIVVALLLSVWTFPAIGNAAALSTGPEPFEVGQTAPGRPLSATTPVALGATEQGGTPRGEASALAAREQAAGDLQNFRGGAAYVYIGSGATLVLILILLILLL